MTRERARLLTRRPSVGILSLVPLAFARDAQDRVTVAWTMNSELIEPALRLRRTSVGVGSLTLLAVACLGVVIALGARSGTPGSTGTALECQTQSPRGRELIQKRGAGESRKALEEVLAGSEDADRLELLGATYEEQGALDEAESCWRRALSLDSNHGQVLLDLGRLALSRRRLDEAV